MKHFPRLGALALAVMLTTAACSGNSRNPIYYPGSARGTVVDRNGDGYDDRTGARIDGRDRNGDGYDDRTGARLDGRDRDRSNAGPNKNKGVRCNAGNGNGNGNGRCRNGNGRGRGRGE